MVNNKNNFSNVYRPSASLIIITPSFNCGRSVCQYQLLLIQRTEATAFAPNHCVFPGGTLEKDADESNEWLQYFKEFGVTEKQLQQLIKPCANRPEPLFSSIETISRHISLRLTAIRETFEEVGVLLCRNRKSFEANQELGYFNDDFDREYWQNAVHKNAKNFLILCKNLQVVPDLWSLYEWSFWRSPTMAQRKFDTVYYIVALEKQPKLLLETNEVESAFWKSPDEYLWFFKEQKIWLPPIIFYELSRFINVPQWFQLLDFIYNRKIARTLLLQLVYYKSPEGRIGTLPGDDFYLNNPEVITDGITIDDTIQQFRQRTKNLHRLIIRDMHDMSVELNICLPDGHLSPINLNCSKL